MELDRLHALEALLDSFESEEASTLGSEREEAGGSAALKQRIAQRAHDLGWL